MLRQVSLPERTQPIRVLLIDDNFQDRSYWCAALKQCSFQFEVLEAPCGDSGLRLYQRQQIDCVVLDLDMPESGFFSLIRLIPDPTHRHVPVVILTKFAPPALIKLMTSHGAFECLLKEYCSAEKLASTIRQAISSAQSKQAV